LPNRYQIDNSRWDIEGGAGKNACHQTYRGTTAGNAPETQGLIAYLQKLTAGEGIKLYLDIHAYSQMFMSRRYSHAVG